MSLSIHGEVSPEFAFLRAFAHVLTDARLRQSVQAGELQSLEPFGVSSEQAQHLAALDRERLDIFAELLVVNRLGKAIEGLPLTTRLLVARLGELSVRFAQESPPERAKKADEAIAFGRFLQTLPDLPPLVQDVLEYELASLELRFQFDGDFMPAPGAPSASYEGPLDAASLRALKSALVPVRLRHHRVLSVRYDMDEIAEQVARGEDSITVEEQPGFLLLHLMPSGALGRAYVNGATFALLEACDGTRTLEQLVSRLVEELGPREDALDSFEAGCLELCASLLERYVLTLRHARGPGR